jgi:hypothetical protein
MTWFFDLRTARAFVLAYALSTLFACGDGDRSPMPNGQDASQDASEPIDAALDATRDTGSEASAPDANAIDAGEIDAGFDAGSDAGDASEPEGPPMSLAETGLYAAGSTSVLADGVMAYAPRYELWSDGAAKLRYLLLPEGEAIDTSDMDAFVFPVGTKAWKEFSHDGVRLETRLLWKTEDGWMHIAYAWNEAQTEAIATTRGAADVLGTQHDIPSRIECRECHDGAGDTLLGVSAFQLAHEGEGLTLDQLEADGRLTEAPPAGLARPDTLEWNALGYLHANCGTCHNPRGKGFDRVDIELWMRTSDLDVTSTRAYVTGVDVAIEQTTGDDTARIEPGSPENSALITRMKLRDAEEAMPPIGSERTDDAGIALVEQWIDSL